MMWVSSSEASSSKHRRSLSPAFLLLAVLSLVFQLWTTSPGFIPLVIASLENSSNVRHSGGSIWRKSILRESVSPRTLQSVSSWSRDFATTNNYTAYLRERGLKRAEEIALLVHDEHGDTSEDRSSHLNSPLMNNEGMHTKTKRNAIQNDGARGHTRTRRMMDMDQIMNDMGVWNNDESTFAGGGSTKSSSESSSTSSHHRNTVTARDSFHSVKIIPDEHHVSAFLNKGVSKRFLFINDKFNNPLSITITPCTSILLWNVKFWPILENGTQPPEVVKSYRTQRSVTFNQPQARRGIYSIDIRPLHWDSYVHLYATSHNSEPRREFDSHNNQAKFVKNDRKKMDSLFYVDDKEKFFQHMFTQADTLTNYNSDSKKFSKSLNDHSNPFNFLSSSAEDRQTNANVDNTRTHFKSGTSGHNKPRIWVKRLRGNRLQVKWDASPVNPHLMNYCIVLNTRRDYSSLCSASGERFGVLPPDLMHVAYYGPSSESNSVIMVDSNSTNFEEQYFANDQRMRRNLKRSIHTGSRRKQRATHEDIVIGCVNKKTNYVLSNLHQGKLYYFNQRDASTNVSYPYLRTTLKYQSPKNTPNGLRDSKSAKVTLGTGSSNEMTKNVFSGKKYTVVKFNLNKPCNELTLYVMPCGGGSIKYEVVHGNATIYLSGDVDSFDTARISMPHRGKYLVKIYQASNAGLDQARMAEVYVSKKNRRFPLPRLPAIPKLSEDQSFRACDSVVIQWWPALDERDDEYCFFLKEEKRRRIFNFKKPNQCDVERSLKSDPYVTHSLCLQRKRSPKTMMMSQKLVGLQPRTAYVVQLIVRRHNGKALSYDLHHVKTSEKCTEVR